jgi:hypothetical protein
MMIASEIVIKNVISEILFDNRICESLENNQIVEYVYNCLYESRLLYGEPVTIEELRKLLHDKIVNFEFIKLDGEIRPAKGTTMMKYIPTSDHPKGIRPSSPKVATFYDLQKMDWRSVSQRSKEIVLKKDEQTGKPVIMVKDKPEGDVAVKSEQPLVTIDNKPVEQPIEKPEVSKVKPIERTEEEKRFYFVNPETGASMIMDLTPKDTIKKLKELGKNWKLSSKEEYDQHEEEIEHAAEENNDYLEVGDVRNYLNKNGENVIIKITGEDPYGGFYAKTPTGGEFKIPANRMKNIGQKIEEPQTSSQKTISKLRSIIDKQRDENLDNIEAEEIE